MRTSEEHPARLGLAHRDRGLVAFMLAFAAGCGDDDDDSEEARATTH